MWGSGQPSLLERYRDKIRGVISCYDRIIIYGTLPGLCYAEGMTSYLNAHNIRIFDYPQWAMPFREEIRVNAENIARSAGLEIEFIRKMKSFRMRNKNLRARLGKTSQQISHAIKRLRLHGLTR